MRQLLSPKAISLASSLMAATHASDAASFELQEPNLSAPIMIATADVKNPTGRTQPVPDTLYVTGEKDDRVPVLNNDPLYDAVFSASFFSSDKDACTYTKITFVDYVAEGDLYITADHCAIDASYLPYIELQGSMQNENGEVENISLIADELWRHPFRPDFDTISEDLIGNPRYDIAILHAYEKNDIKPAYFIPVNWHSEESNEEEFNDDADNLVINGTGYSRDLVGLHTHMNIEIDEIHGQLFSTNMDAGRGASGGPVHSLLEYENEADRIAVFGVNAAILKTNKTIHVALRPEMLETVPFLQKRAPELHPHFKEVAKVIPERGLNMRYGASTEYDRIVPDDNGVPSALPWGSTVTIHARVNGELGKEWALVTAENGRSGYVRAQFLETLPQPQSTQLPMVAFIPQRSLF